MQPMVKHREVITGGTLDSTAFTISMKDQAHIKSILRDTLYSDKILAVLREYSANAWDAHRMAGKADLPIKIQLPTYSEPILVIKDFGSGLSHEDVFEVFAKYGASTKRESNEAVGMLGIGSKSGFAYSDTFTIISRHGGKARTYVALLDESENDAISLLCEEDCGEDTGLTIQIAVRPEDIREFETKARDLFQHFIPRPDINTWLPSLPAIRAKLTHGMIYDRTVNANYEESQWFAIMGCVPYRIDLKQLTDSNGENLINESFKRTSGLLNFEIGEIQINASREALKYSKITKEALVLKFEALLEEFVTVVLDEIEKSASSDWEKRVQAQILLRLGLGAKEVGELGEDTVSFVSPKSFVFRRYTGSTTQHIDVRSEVRLIRKTHIGKRQIKGYELGRNDYLIDPAATGYAPDGSALGIHSWDVVNAELEELIKASQMTGITVVDLNTLPWKPSKSNRAPKEINAKHMVSSFRLIKSIPGDKLSDQWEIVNRQPTEDDVFVIISYFSTNAAEESFDIYHCRREDEQIAKSFGITLPEIYGYKTTAKKPLTADKLTGIHYPEWRKKFFASLSLDKVKELVETQAWAGALRYGFGYIDSVKIVLERLQQSLGENHPICVFIQKGLQFRHKYDSSYANFLELLTSLGILHPAATEAKQAQRAIHKKYPLLAVHGLQELWGTNATEWQRYAKLIDASTTNETLVTPEKVEG